MLESNPGRIVDRLLDACPHCATAWPAEPQTPLQVYDRIELPPVSPDVTRVRLFGGRCACCGERAVAAAPTGFEPGSPFGRSIEAIAVYLHYPCAAIPSASDGTFRQLRPGNRYRTPASGVRRVVRPIDQRGAICDILARAQARLEAAASAIAPLVAAWDVVASDETSMHISCGTLRRR